MNTTWYRLALIAVAAALTISCATSTRNVDVTSNYDPEADFGSYKTYSWIEPTDEYDGWRPPAHMDIRLRRVVDDIMAAKGFERTSAVPTANLLLVYYASVHQELRVGGAPMGLYPGWASTPGSVSPFDPTDVRRHDRGTVMLDMIDQKSGQIVWTGKVVSAIRSENPPSNRMAVVAGQLLKDFPPQ